VRELAVEYKVVMEDVDHSAASWVLEQYESLRGGSLNASGKAMTSRIRMLGWVV